MVTRKKKIVYWIAGILTGLLVIIGALTAYVALKFEPIIRNQLQKQVAKSSNGLYQLKLDGIGINLFLGRIYLEAPKLIPDTILYQKLKQNNIAPPSLYTFSAEYVRLSAIDFRSLYLRRELDVGLLMVNQPKLKLVKDLDIKQPEQKSGSKNLYQLISKVFRSVTVDEIKVVDGDVVYKRTKGTKTTTIEINNFTILLDEVLVDSLSNIDSSRFFYAKNIRVQVDNYIYSTPNKQYDLKIGQFNLSTKDSSILLQNVAMIPRYSKLEFAHKVGEQIDRFNIKADSVSIAGVQLKTLLFDERIIADHITIIKPTIESFRDKNVPRRNLKRKLLFHEMLQQVPHEVFVKKIYLSDGYVEYTELPDGSKNPGTVYFSNLKGTFSNVTNIIDAQRPYITVDANAFLMGSGVLEAEFKLPVDPKQPQFIVSGSIKSMDLRRLSPAVEKLAFVKIKSGSLSRMSFTINANPVSSKTYMKFLYDDLEIQLLNKQTGTTENQGLASTVVNALIIEKSNPVYDVPPRIANVSYSRDQTRSIFNFLWKSLFTALKPSVGVSTKKEMKIYELKNRMRANKERKKQKREERQRQREEKESEIRKK